MLSLAVGADMLEGGKESARRAEKDEEGGGAGSGLAGWEEEERGKLLGQAVQGPLLGREGGGTEHRGSILAPSSGGCAEKSDDLERERAERDGRCCVR